MKQYYVFKLNLQPKILKGYNFYGDAAEVVSNVIPLALDDIFERTGQNDSFIKYRNINNIEEVLNNPLFIEIDKDVKNLIDRYDKVVSNYKKTNEIKYDKKYMNIREKLKSNSEALKKQYTFLSNAEDVTILAFTENKVSEIQMGVAYIERALKIIKYIRDANNRSDSFEFYYSTEDESICIEKVNITNKNKSEEEAKKIAEQIKDKINSFKDQSSIGEVSINPIYEKFEIKEGNYKEVTIQLVYPNGDPSDDRFKARAFAAAKIDSKYTASEDDFIDIGKVEEVYSEDGKDGYVKSIRSKGKNILKDIIKVISF